MTEDGKPYGPFRFKQIVRECYLISKNCNTSYLDVQKITPVERDYLLEFIADEARQTQEKMEELQKNRGQ